MKQWIKSFTVDKVIRSLGYTIFVGWTVIGLFVVFGYNIENRYFPIFKDQKISNINYNPLGCLCWTWEGTKLRDKDAITVDVVLKDKENRSFIMGVFSGATLLPFKQQAENPVGRVSREWCTFLPGGLRGNSPYTIKMSLDYAGFLHLWTVTNTLPTIVYDGPSTESQPGDPEFLDPRTNRQEDTGQGKAQ